MGELALLSLLTGSLGIQSLFMGLWLRSSQQRQNLQFEDEEEQLTPYDSKDTIDPMDAKVIPKDKKGNNDPRLTGWEFKILRSAQDCFRDSQVFKQVVEEESIAGWILLEKLDDRRLRFKRPIAMREVLREEMLPIDPYRTTYGQASPWQRLGLIAIGVITLLLPSYLGFLLIHQMINRPTENPANQKSSELGVRGRS